jgi:hypothetical protein
VTVVSSKLFSIEVTTSSEELLFQERPMTPENPEAVRASAIATVFIYRKTTKPQTNFFMKVFYKAGDRTEHLLCKLQIFRRIPLRSQNYPMSSSGFLAIACALICVRPIQTSWRPRRSGMTNTGR